LQITRKSDATATDLQNATRRATLPAAASGQRRSQCPMQVIPYRPAAIALLSAGICAAGICCGGSAIADDPARIAVTIKDHVFSPSEIHVPVGKPTLLIVTNQDSEPEEFDSTALKVEKVIVGGTYATIRLRPLGPGRYKFMGEFHPETAQGVVVSE
jgi:Cupredoxin-like domain